MGGLAGKYRSCQPQPDFPANIGQSDSAESKVLPDTNRLLFLRLIESEEIVGSEISVVTCAEVYRFTS